MGTQRRVNPQQPTNHGQQATGQPDGSAHARDESQHPTAASIHQAPAGQDNGQQQTTEETQPQDGQTPAADVQAEAVEKRRVAAALQTALAAKRCRHCAVQGMWKVEHTEGRARYVRCTACRRVGDPVYI